MEIAPYIYGNASIDSKSYLIPARRVETLVETSAKTEMTGERKEPDKPAIGQVTFINKADERVIVPRDIGVSTRSGVRFSTVSEVTVPPGVGSIASVAVVAATPGEVGNVTSNAIDSILDNQLAFKLNVTNEQPIEGGTDKQVKNASVADQERLRKALLEDITADGLQKLSSVKKETEHVDAESIKAVVITEDFQQSPNQDSPWLEMKARILLSGLAFDSKDIDIVAADLLSKQNEEKAKVMRDTLRTQVLDAYECDDKHVSFNVFVQSAVVPILDKEKIKQEVAGKTTKEAIEYVRQNFSLVKPPQIVVFPSWADSMPKLNWRIVVEVMEDEERR